MTRRRPRERGIALLLVLWVFMTLGVLALDFGRYIRDDAMSAVNFAEEARGYYLALAGMNRALFYATIELQEKTLGRTPGSEPVEPQEPSEFAVPIDGGWHDGTYAGGGFRVRMIDEESRVSINSPAAALVLPVVIKNLLREGNTTTGIDRRTQTNIDSIVNSILDWRDRDNRPKDGGAESEYYLSLPHPYRAKNALFDSPEELLLVKGITPALFYGTAGRPGLRDVVTASHRKPNLYIRSLTPQVLQALLGLGPDEITELVAQLQGDADALALVVQSQIVAAEPALGPFIKADNHEPRFVSIEARADTKSDRNQSAVAGVVELPGINSSGEDVRFLRWFDRAPWSGTLPTPPGSEDVS